MNKNLPGAPHGAWKAIKNHRLISKEKFAKAFPFASEANIERFYIPFCDTIERYDITTPKRLAAFIAQLAHESGSLRYVEEIASGEAYEGRKDLGNTKPGDGVRFKGRGLIQITGRANYQAIANEFDIPQLMDQPEILERPEWAVLSAGWFWNRRNLNDYADNEDFRKITKLINGGYNGYEDRLKSYEYAKAALYAS